MQRGVTMCDSKLLQLRRVAAIKVKNCRFKIAEGIFRFPAVSMELQVRSATTRDTLRQRATSVRLLRADRACIGECYALSVNR